MTNKKSKKSNKTTKRKNSYETLSDESGEEFEVEKILDKKTVRGTIMYLLKWKGFSNSESSWEKKRNLNCPELIKEFEDTVKKANEKKIEKNILKEKNTTRKRNELECSMKRKLRSSKTSSTSRKNTQNINNLPIKTASTSNKNTQNTNDLPVKAGSKAKHTRKKSAELNKSEVLKKRYDGSKAKHTSKKSAELNKCEVIKKRYDDFETKHTRNKSAALNKHEATKKQYDDFGAKRTRKKSVERNEVTKKKYDDLTPFPTGNKNKKLKDHEINRRKYVDNGSKRTGYKTTELKESEVVMKKRCDDHGSKHPEKKYAELKEHEIIKKRSDGSAPFVSGNKNMKSNDHKIIKERYYDYGDKGNREKENLAVNGYKKRPVRLNQTPYKAVQRSIRSQIVPKIQHLHYFVRSKSFPINRKDGACSIMSVSFKGSNVLKGFERLVEAGIAVDPLPNILCAEPIRTGKTDFTITV